MSPLRYGSLVCFLCTTAALDLTVPFPHDVEWRLPFGCDFSGFFVEVVLGFIPSLYRRIPSRLHLLHGRCPETFLQAKLTPDEAAIYRAVQTEDRDRSAEQSRVSIAVEHADPCRMREFRPGEEPLWLISRSMSEGDIPPSDAECLLRADEVWVPTEYHRQVFAARGVPQGKLQVIPEIVDTDFFSPDGVEVSGGRSRDFTFLSVFKWEWRKGWDVLLDGYWSAFKSSDPVVLMLRTWKPGWEAGPEDINEWIASAAKKRGSTTTQLARIQVVPEDLSRMDLRQLYRDSDAFVLPSRGEGWGLPVMEAMAMQLPIITTNHSGPTAFCTDNNSYLLRVRRVYPDGKAEPSAAHLKQLLKQVHSRPQEARARGAQARADIAGQYSPEAVGGIITKRLQEIAELIAAPKHDEL